MSDASQGPGWWLASDGKWYPPESKVLAPPLPPVPPRAEAGSGGPVVRPAPARSYWLGDRDREMRLSRTQRIGIVVAAIGVFVFAAMSLQDLGYQIYWGDCGRDGFAFLKSLFEQDDYVCSEAAKEQMLAAVIAGGFWFLIGGLMVALFPDRDR